MEERWHSFWAWLLSPLDSRKCPFVCLHLWIVCLHIWKGIMVVSSANTHNLESLFLFLYVLTLCFPGLTTMSVLRGLKITALKEISPGKVSDQLSCQFTHIKVNNFQWVWCQLGVEALPNPCNQLNSLLYISYIHYLLVAMLFWLWCMIKHRTIYFRDATATTSVGACSSCERCYQGVWLDWTVPGVEGKCYSLPCSRCHGHIYCGPVTSDGWIHLHCSQLRKYLSVILSLW